MPCLVCGRKCIAESKFPNDQQDTNYPKKCGLTALYWVQMHVIRFQKKPKMRKVTLKSEKNICEWLTQMNHRILPGCVSWHQADSRYTAVHQEYALYTIQQNYEVKKRARDASTPTISSQHDDWNSI